MSLTINTNHAAVTAGYNLSRNNDALQKSLARLSSGKRIIQTSDDAGGLAVSMKLNASINRLRGVSNNIQNAMSYLDVQDGVLQRSCRNSLPDGGTEGPKSGCLEKQLRH